MTSDRRVVPVAWAGFLLIGWSGVLVPTLVRQVEARFGVDDAGIGLWFLATALAYAFASFGGGVLTERFGRRLVLGAAAGLLAAGLALQGAAPAWPWFLLAAPILGLGGGAIDGGMNGLLLAISPDGRGRALNLLHTFFSIGAFVSPFVVGRLVSGGLDWQLLLFGSAIVAMAIAVALSLVPLPSGRRSAGVAADRGSPAAATPATRQPRGPLILLAIAIACYVASEVGVSNWIVRFLERADLDTATLALSGFWAGLALGRLAASRVADRLPHGRLAAAAAFVAGLAVAAAVASPSIELSMVALTVAGFASGPVFPTIIAIGGDLDPDRLATTAGSLTAVAVVGGTIYPPLIGLMSGSIGIAGGMLGAGLLSIVSGVAVLAATRRA